MLVIIVQGLFFHLKFPYAQFPCTELSGTYIIIIPEHYSINNNLLYFYINFSQETIYLIQCGKLCFVLKIWASQFLVFVAMVWQLIDDCFLSIVQALGDLFIRLSTHMHMMVKKDIFLSIGSSSLNEDSQELLG